MGAKKQTIGYHYIFSVLFGIGRGPFDEMRMIKVGDRIAWDGHACDDSLQRINKPELFGGEKKEGGIQGLFRLQQGQADQVLPGAESGNVGFGGPYKSGTLPNVKTSIGGRMGELRGRVTLWYDGLMSSMNPYVKEWKFRIRRSRSGWDDDDCWYPQKATIFLADGHIFAMNGAHIIYECATNRSWGRGLPRNKMGPTWVYAADTLCAEGFGLCLVWYRQEEIGEFIKVVCDHIGCAVYTDRETGLIEIKLIRDDYDPDDLPVFTFTTGLLDILEDDSASSDAVSNEVIVTGHSPLTDEDIMAKSHNVAARVAQGSTSTLNQKYPGLPTVDLCGRVAQRDLVASASGLRKFKVVLDRKGFKLHPGAVFRVQAPTRGIGDVILRVGDIDDGQLLDGKITVAAVQDVFGLPDTTFVKPSDNTWTPPTYQAEPAEAEEAFEAGYRDIYLKQGAADAESVLPGDSYLATVASPSPGEIYNSYDIMSQVDGEGTWTTTTDNFFTPTATLVGDVGPLDTMFVLSGETGMPDDIVGDSCRIGDEIVRVESYDPDTHILTVERGAADTWPVLHADGTRVWFPDDDVGADGRAYLDGEAVNAYVLPRTSADVLADSEANLLSVVMDGRVARPYPPADVKVNTISVYGAVGIQAEPELTWVERNRITQADHLVGFFEAAVTAEPGTTFRVRVYDTDGSTLLRTEDAVTSGWTYDAAMQAVDNPGTAVYFELVAVRDNVESWKPRRFRVALVGGWGYGWGKNWGGA